MKLTKLTEAEYMTFPHSSFLQAWSWGEFLVAQGNTVERLGLMDEGQLVVTAQVVIKKLPFGLYSYIPYGPEGGDAKQVAAFYKLLPYNSHVFTRVEPMRSEFIPAGARRTKNIQPGRTLVIDLGKPEGDLLKEMHHKTRYNISVAKRHGVIARELTKEEWQIGTQLLHETAVRQGYKDQGVAYYTHMLSFLTEGPVKARLLGAWHESMLLAVGLFIDSGDTRTYLFGGSREEQKNVMAPHALHWWAITDAQALGQTRYDFWGIETASGQTPGFVRFKMGFGGNEVRYPGAVDIVHSPLWYNVYTHIRKLNRLFRRK